MQIRQATENDLGFIFETFLRSFRAASTHAEGLENGKVVKLLRNLLDRGWKASVADAEGYLAGWIVFGPNERRTNELAWIYVRDMFRHANYPDYYVSRMLINSAGIDTKKGIFTPFLPTRVRKTWKFIHRPFEVVA